MRRQRRWNQRARRRKQEQEEKTKKKIERISSRYSPLVSPVGEPLARWFAVLATCWPVGAPLTSLTLSKFSDAILGFLEPI